jgi:hypothetical protein
MKHKLFTPGFIFILAAILAAAFFRLIPHLPNFTPVAAIALFGGTYLNRKVFAFIIPLMALFISDIFIGFHTFMPAVYVSFIIIVALGFIVRKNIGIASVLTASIASSLLFFLITNFAVWFSSPFYTQDLSGLLKCYAMGLPFLNNGILGDIFFNTSLFGLYFFACRRFSILAKI